MILTLVMVMLLMTNIVLVFKINGVLERLEDDMVDIEMLMIKSGQLVQSVSDRVTK